MIGAEIDIVGAVAICGTQEACEMVVVYVGISRWAVTLRWLGQWMEPALLRLLMRPVGIASICRGFEEV